MKFKNFEQLIKGLNKPTGDEWSIKKTSSTNNENFIDFEASYLGNNVECFLKDFGEFPQNKTLSLDDFKYYLKISGRELNNIYLVQNAIIYHYNKKTNRTYFEYIIKRKFPLDTKLEDGSLLIENLENFAWNFNWKDGYVSGYHAIPPQAQISINAQPTEKVLKFIENKPFTKDEIIPVTHHANVYVWLGELRDKTLSNINHPSDIEAE